MVTEDQREIITFLSSPSTHAGHSVERIDTHASIVFLAGTRALKLKRAVKYDYLDFSTVARRRATCEAEVRINRRTAPALYRGVMAVTREADGALCLGGAGAAVDWLVEMRRFPQDDLLDRRAARRSLAVEMMRPLASAIAHLHRHAEHRSDHGGAAGMAWVVDGNAISFAQEGARFLDPSAGVALTRSAHRVLDVQRSLLDARRDRGFVRQCHGDLHLRNIVLLDGAPTLFDAIEFNDEIACIDVLYDLAFLLMDLWRRQLSPHANEVWNGYLFETADLDGLPLLPLFLSCRAAVRAKTSATAANLQSDAVRRRELEQLAKDYLAMAQRLLEPAPACVIAIGGPSGSGKSTLARALAPCIGAVPGAVVIRSDEVRKQLAGVDTLQHLGPDGYGAEMTQRVYASLAERAAIVVGAGHAAIVDAVYARADDRHAIERAAAATHTPCVGLWLDAPESLLLTRVAQRQHDASDADATVIRRQLAAEIGPLSWHRLDASLPAEVVRHNAHAVLSGRLTRGAFRDGSAGQLCGI